MNAQEIFQSIGSGFRPFPESPQAFFLVAPWSEGMYGGGAGGGKTETLLNDPIPDLLKYPGTSALFLRREFSMLEDVIPRLTELLAPFGGAYNEAKHRFTLPNSSRYYLGHLQKESAKLRYQGREFGIIAFDELTHFTETQYLYLFSRNRSKYLPQEFWRMRSGTNPGGPGHGWVKRRFIDALDPNRYAYFFRWKDQDMRVPAGFPNSKTRFWTPSLVSDNPIYAGSEYEANLMALPDEERRMLLEGDWDIFSGQFFGTWRAPLHVIEPFSLTHHYDFYSGMDYGEKSPLCYVIIAVDHEGNMFLVDEYYNTEKDRSIEEHVEIIKAMEDKLPKPVIRRLSDWNVFSAVTRDYRMTTSKTIDQMFSDRGISLTRANKDRLAGWRNFKEVLDWKSKQGDLVFRGLEDVAKMPQLRIFSTCRNSIRTIPDQVYNTSITAQRKEEASSDLDTLGEDHAVDAIRYVLMHVIPAYRKKRLATGWREKYINGIQSIHTITYR